MTDYPYVKGFRDLQVWRKAHALVLAVYGATAVFSRHETYGLTSQMRRSCVSIPANIAEGCGRDGDAGLARFLRMAAGSASELEYHLLLARDLHLLAPQDHRHLADEIAEIKRMLTTFVKRLKGATKQGQQLTAES
ncbi:MAG TPA: four helix bundle protein [Rubrobacter sp.]|nr:four helix bundle protein [Rubrobacter sp.]